MKKPVSYFEFLIWILSAVTFFFAISSGSSFKHLLFSLVEWLLIVSTYYGIFLFYINGFFKKKYSKIFGVFILILILVTHVLKIILLTEIGDETLKLGYFFKLSLFLPTLTVFTNSILFGLLLCVLLWFFRQPKRKMIRITGVSLIILSIVLVLGYLFLNRDLSDKGIYFNYEINTLSEVQDLAISKQKTIYLDFWHSGCGPCLQEFSVHDQFQKHVDTDKVHLMFVGADRSIGGEKQKQRILIEKYELKGTHSFVSREEFSKMLDEAGYNEQIYGVKAFPHHLIIGRDGTILDIKAGKPTREMAVKLNTIK